MRYLLCLVAVLLAVTGAHAMQASSDESIPREDVERIGNLLLEAAPQRRGRILLIAELDDGFMVSRLLWHAPGAPSLSQLGISDDLNSRLFEAALESWEESSRQAGRTGWTTMSFLVEDGRFSVRVGPPPGAWGRRL